MCLTKWTWWTFHKHRKNSPKNHCGRGFYGKVGEENKRSRKCFGMTDDRNLTSHTYVEEVADGIYAKIRVVYVLLRNVAMQK